MIRTGSILRPLAGRLLHSIVTLWLVTLVFFALTDLLPGDFATATATRDTSREQIETLQHELGLFTSAPKRYVEWLSGFVRGDLGTSWWTRKPIMPLIGERLAHSAWLVFWATLFAVPAAMLLAITAVIRRGGIFDRLSSASVMAVMSVPEFMMAYGLMGLLAVHFRIFPVHSMFVFDMPLGERLWASGLPILSLAAVTITPIFRMARAALINELSADYIQMAELKGLKRRRILIWHALPNAAAPIANIVVLAIANLFVGLVIIESIFSYPGIGELLITGVKLRDVPLVQACALASAIIYIGLNFLADAITILANPRLRFPSGGRPAGLFTIANGGKIFSTRLRLATVALTAAVLLVAGVAVHRVINKEDVPVIAMPSPPASDVRDQLTATTLLGEQGHIRNFVHYDYFKPLGTSEAPKHTLEGRIRVPEFRAWQRHAWKRTMTWKATFPGFDFNVVAHGTVLLPVERDRLLKTADGGSYVILSPGRLWSEPGDGDWSRGSFPFTVTPAHGTIPSYGVATFLFNGKSISNVRVQIAQEGANWAQYDLWGQGAAAYAPMLIEDAQGVRDAYAMQVATQLDVRPWAELADRYWRSLEAFDGDGNRHNITVSGLMVDDVFYLRPCRTRAGPHPFCREMRHGVFSITKTLGAAVSMLWLAKKYGPGVFEEKITDYIKIPAAHVGWKNVTFGNALDMTTGIGNTMPYRVDTYVEADRSAASGRVWRARSIRNKLDAMAGFKSYPWGPGEVTRYRTSDTTALSAAMEAFLRTKEGPDVDLWATLTREIFAPLGIDRLPVRRSIEPDGRPGTPLLGAGLFITVEETLKIARLLQNHGAHEGKQLLHRELTKRAISNDMDRGFRTGWRDRQGGEAHYAMSFWLSHHKRSMFGCSVRIPGMAGFGGNYVMVMPNRTIGLRFADGHDDDVFTWDSYGIRRISDRVRPFC